MRILQVRTNFLQQLTGEKKACCNLKRKDTRRWLMPGSFVLLMLIGNLLIAQPPRQQRPIVLTPEDTTAFPTAPVGFDQKADNIQRGRIDSVQYDSKTVGSRRKLFVYIPPGYSANKKYPVLYLLHGIGGNEREWFKWSTPDVTLDNLYANKKIEPMIVVFPNGRAMKNDADTGNVFSMEKIQAFGNFEKDLLNEASEVTVGGDFTLGSPAAKLVKSDNGLWTYTTGPIPPDSYTYNFNVDGVNTLDTKSAEFKENPNALFNYFIMNGPETDFFALKNVPHGRVERVWYHSSSLNAERRMHVYLPPGYENIKDSLPVLYLLHGGGDNDISWTGAAKANLILDNLYADGKLKNMIVVMPAGHTPGKGFSMGTGPEQDPFCKDLLQDIISFVEKTYPASSKREDRAIAGFSMGGIQTLNTALWNPEKFGYVCPMGTGFFLASIKEIDEKYSQVLKNPAINQFKLFYIGKGKDDQLTAANNKAMLQMFDKYGIKYKYQEFPGAHSFVFTRRYLAFFAPLLFR